MRITRIFLDLDDVLNIFTPYALQYVGCPASSVYDPIWGFDIIRAVNELHPYSQGWLPKEFWRRITREVWANCPKSAEFDFLLTQSQALVGRENISILTTPIEDPDCLAGKLEWIHRYLPKWLHRQYVITPQKYLLAQPGALLIDDSNANCNDFIINKDGTPTGGQSLLVPRPWNAYHGLDSMSHLNARFEDLQYLKRSA